MFRVTFTYVVDIDHDDITNKEEAKELAMAAFIDQGDYQYSDIEVEEITEY